jgi:hypothetical protein
MIVAAHCNQHTPFDIVVLRRVARRARYPCCYFGDFGADVKGMKLKSKVSWDACRQYPQVPSHDQRQRTRGEEEMPP